MTEPPMWFINIDGRRVEFDDSEVILSQRLFKQLSMNYANKIWDKITDKRWTAMIQELLANVTEIEAPDDASASGQFVHYFSQFVDTRGQDVDRDRLLAGNAWLDEETESVYFRSPDLLEYFKKQGMQRLTPQKLWSELRKRLGAEKGQFHVKGKNVQWWRVALAKIESQDDPFTVPEFKDPLDDS